MSLIECRVLYDTDTQKLQFINSSTNELIEINFNKQIPVKKSAKLTETVPKIILSTNKIILNQATVTELDVEPGSFIAIGYMKVRDQGLCPVIGKPDVVGIKGNKLTKSLTVACRGKSYDELSRYGDEFTLEKNPDGSNSYILIGNKKVEKISIPEISADPDTKIIEELSSFSGEEFADVENITPSDLESLLNF